ncbi:MAG: hypothetical protein HY319_18865 [Armatimonadetes bacterium]|nr:hypothetical protein [Armatimonadota bacterium]
MRRIIICALIFCGLLAAVAFQQQGELAAGEGKGGSGWAPAVKPKPLGDETLKGVKWLIAHQHQNGGWGQGEESQNMGGGGELAGVPNVADTCIATLALMRAGSTPSDGPYAKNIARAISFVVSEVDASDPDSLYVTSVRGTRVQSKLGPYIDTFLSSMVLAEAQGQMPDDASKKRVSAALDKVLRKIQKNQRADGTWDDNGWAPALSQSMATKGLNRAVQSGAEVDEETLKRAEKHAVSQYDSSSGSFKSEGSAGVSLYATAATTSAMQDSMNTNAAKEKELREVASNSKDEKKRDQARNELGRIAGTRKAQEESRQTLVRQLDDDSFVKGFGSNGGEEFLSYMNISETLVVQGGPEWKSWDQGMSQNLSRIQNADGSWSGHHCITGRTFCTAAALLVLTADRAPVPVAARVRD